MTAYSKALVAFGAIAQTAAFTAVVPKASITQRSFFLPSYPRPSINPPASSLFAAGDDESLQNCLIVIRHGLDVDNNKRKNGERTKTLPNGEKVVYYQDGLNEDGKKQAKSIAKLLPKLVDDLDISAITRVITKDPRTTPNPFDTILPFIEAQNIMDVRLPSTLDGIKNSQLFPDDTSVLVCFDQEVLWSPKVNGKRAPKPSSESLLHYVNKAYEIDTDIPGPPEEGRTIYIYRGKGEMEVHKLDHLHDIVLQMF